MADIAFEKDLAVTETGIGASCRRPRRPRRLARLVQGELAARQDDRPGHPGPQGRPEQHLLQRQPRRHPRHPRGALGQVRLRRARLGSAPGWTCSEGSATYGRSTTTVLDPPRPSTSRAAWATPSRRWRTAPPYTYLVDAHWSPRAEEDLHLREPRRPGARHRLADPRSTRPPSPRRTKPPDAQGRRPVAPKRTSSPAATASWAIAIRALAERGVAKDFDFCDIDTFDTCPTRTPTQKYDWSLYGTVINCGAYTAVDRLRPRGPRRRLEGQRHRAGASGPHLRRARDHPWSTCPPTTSSTAPPRSMTRTSLSARCPSYGQTKAAGDIAVAGCPSPLHHALQLGHRRGATSSRP